jgi:hypothetical protein
MAIDNTPTFANENGGLLCVLGMHRSGTSVVTQFLHRLGMTVAPELLEAMDGVNDEGFWEDRHVVELNEKLLLARNSRWHDCGIVTTETMDLGAEEEIRSEAIAHFKRNYRAEGFSVVKDPRLCRSLPFWFDVWRDAGLSPIFIHVVRHPFAVAKSLQKRDRIPYECGITLWLLHTVESMLDCSGQTELIVIYDEFLRQPLRLPQMLVSKCGVALPAAETSWQEIAGATIKENLRRNDNSINTSLGLRELIAFSVSLYETISAFAYGSMDRNQLESWRNDLQGLLVRYGDDIAMLQRLAADLMDLSATSVRVGELHSKALAVIQTKDAEIQTKDTMIQTQGSEIRAKDVEMQEKDVLIQAIKVEVQNKDALIQARDIEIQIKSVEIQEKNAAIADRNQIIGDITHLRLWRLMPRIMRRIRKS